MQLLKQISVKAIATLSVLLFSVSANAEFIKGDYDVLGDGKVALDTSTGIEWLNITLTRSYTINTITPLLDSDFKGFRVATKEEVDQMVQNILPSLFTSDTYYAGRDGSTSSATSIVVDEDEARNFRETFAAHGDDYAYGAFLNENSEDPLYNAGFMGSNPWDAGQVAYYDLRLTKDDDAFAKFHSALYNGRGSVFLVSGGGESYSSLNDSEYRKVQEGALSVPSPLSVGAFSMVLLGLTLRRKK